MLLKQGRRTGLMQTRYHVLRGDALLTYRDAKCTDLASIIILKGLFIKKVKVDKNQEFYALRIRGKNSSSTEFVKHLYHKSESVIDTWVSLLKEAAGQHEFSDSYTYGNIIG